MRKRTLLHGGNALLLSLAVIGSAVVGYVLVDRYRPFRIDVTKSGMHSLAPKTIEILERLDREVEVTFFLVPRQLGADDATFINQRVTDLLEEYQVRSKGKVRYSLADPLREEPLLEELGGDLGAAVFQAGDQKIVVQAKEIFRTSAYDMGDGGQTKFTGEEAFDAALLKLMEGKSRTACFLAGHGEASIDDTEGLGYAYAKELLRRENFESREVRLDAGSRGGDGAQLRKPIALDGAEPEAPIGVAAIPADCTVLVIAGPSASISTSDADAVAAYFAKGNGVVLLAEPMTSSGVEKLGEKLGVEILPGVAADPAAQKRSPLTIIPGYGRHEIVNDLYAAELPVVLQRAVGLRAPAAADPKTTLTPMLATTENGMELVDIKDGVADPASQRNIKGPITLAFAVERVVSESEGQSKVARAVVIGDADFARNASIEQLSQQVGPGNVDLLKNSVSWAAGASDRIGISPKDPDYDTVTISDRGGLWVLFSTGILLPMGIFGTGISVWLRRRRR